VPRQVPKKQNDCVQLLKREKNPKILIIMKEFHEQFVKNEEINLKIGCRGFV